MSTAWTLALACTLAAAGAAADEETVADDPWRPFAFLVGEWTGREEGSFGTGTGTRVVERILQGRYLSARNASVFEPQPSHPEGERHEDLSILSYDQGRDAYVLRQFNSEGYVNRFVLAEGAPASPDDELERLVFVSEASENAPPGLRARLTWEIDGPDRFHETFELAPPGADFSVMLRNTWTRAD